MPSRQTLSASLALQQTLNESSEELSQDDIESELRNARIAMNNRINKRGITMYDENRIRNVSQFNLRGK